MCRLTGHMALVIGIGTGGKSDMVGKAGHHMGIKKHMISKENKDMSKKKSRGTAAAARGQTQS